MKFYWLETVAKEAIQTSLQWGEELNAHQKTELAQIKKERAQQSKEIEASKVKKVKEESEEEQLYVPKKQQSPSQQKPEASNPGTEPKVKEDQELIKENATEETINKQTKQHREEKQSRKGPNTRRGGRDYDHAEYVPKESQKVPEDAVYVPKTNAPHKRPSSKDKKSDVPATKGSHDPAAKPTTSSQTESQSKHSEANHQSSKHSAYPQKQAATNKQKHYE